MNRRLIFVSSVQKELADERRAIKDFILSNRLLGRHFDVFLFEDLPAKDRRPDELYLDYVERCSVFASLFGGAYGWEDPADGISPTEREFDHATTRSKHRLVYLKNVPKEKLHPKMAVLIKKAQSQLTYRRFNNTAELTAAIYDSLIEYLEEEGVIQSKPFDAAEHPTATLADISADKIAWFLKTARRERNLSLSASASADEALTHLKLLNDGRLTNAALLLFAKEPQRFVTSAVVKCAHYHGIEVAKPIPSAQMFDDTLFDQVDGAVDFVMSKLDRTVGTRSDTGRAPVKYEIAKEAVAEIIVNAVAHRDYASNASVQVSVFSDRIEVWNPGRLPQGLTPEQLAMPHSSEPANPLIAQPLYFAHYIESLGTGTVDVIRLCREAELPFPDFEQRGNQFVVTIWRQWLTAEFLAGLELNVRQLEAVPVIREQRRLSTREYQEVTGASRATAKRDLEELVQKGILVARGAGRGAYYQVPKKWLKNGSNGSSKDSDGNGSKTAQTAQNSARRRKGKKRHTKKTQSAKTKSSKSKTK